MSLMWQEADSTLSQKVAAFLKDHFGAVGQALVSNDVFDRNKLLAELTEKDISDIAHNIDLAVGEFAQRLGHKCFSEQYLKELPIKSETLRLSARMAWLIADKPVSSQAVDDNVLFFLSKVPLHSEPR